MSEGGGGGREDGEMWVKGEWEMMVVEWRRMVSNGRGKGRITEEGEEWRTGGKGRLVLCCGEE